MVREAARPPLVAQTLKRGFGKAASARNRPTQTCHGTRTPTTNAKSTEINRDALFAMRHIHILSTRNFVRVGRARRYGNEDPSVCLPVGPREDRSGIAGPDTPRQCLPQTYIRMGTTRRSRRLLRCRRLCCVSRARRTSGQSAANRSEYRQAAGAVAEAVIRSVELIVQPNAYDVVGEMGARCH